MRYAFAALAAMSILVAGCASQEKAPSTSSPPISNQRPSDHPLPPTINESLDLFSLRPQLVDCRAAYSETKILTEDVAKALPEGYSIEATSTTTVVFSLFACKSVIVNNSTVIPNVSLYETSVLVTVNDAMAGEAIASRYVFELVASNQTIVNLLRAMGFNATIGEIVLDPTGTADGSPVHARVSSEGNKWYELEGFNGVGPAPERTFLVRYHQLGLTGQRLWIDHNETKDLPGQPGAATMEVSGGILSKMRPSDAGTVVTGPQFGQSKGTFAFGRLP